MKWHPIATAPKHTRLLVYFKQTKLIDIATLNGGEWIDDEGAVWRLPTFWQTLPEPPS